MVPSYLTIKRFIFVSVIIVIITVSIGTYISIDLIEQNKEKAIQNVGKSLYLQAAGKAESVNLWRKKLVGVGNYITRTEIIQLFSKEISSKEKQATEKTPYVSFILREFVEKNELIKAKIIGSNYSEKYKKELSKEQMKGVELVFTSGKSIVLPFYTYNKELAIDVIKPIFNVGNFSDEVVGALLVTHKVSSELNEILQPSILANIKGNIYLIQINADKTISYVKERQLVSLKNSNGVNNITIGDKDFIYKQMVPVKNTNLRILYEYDTNNIQATLYKYNEKITSSVALGIILVTMLLFVVIWSMRYKYSRDKITLQEQTLKALVRTVALRDPHLAEHNTSLSRCALRVANQLKISVNDRTTLFYSTLLSCVSKLSVPEKILNKPGALTPAEMKIVKDSISQNFKNIEKMEFDLPIQCVVIQMYERLDGTGHPKQLSGNEVTFLARILGACDVYCALTSSRSYRKKLTHREAIEEMRKQEEKFDKLVLDTINDVMELVE